MRYCLIFLVSLSLVSCFRFNGRILIQNDKTGNLLIETNPIISSVSGGWENGIHYYNRDSIIWTYGLGNNIHARIIEPRYWKGRDSIFAQGQPDGHHFGDYGFYRYDTTVNGVYSIYPNSSFTIGELNTKKKTVPSKEKLNGRFEIRRLTIFDGQDTLVANGDREIWDLLLRLDKNEKNFDKEGHRKKIRDWVVSIR